MFQIVDKDGKKHGPFETARQVHDYAAGCWPQAQDYEVERVGADIVYQRDPRGPVRA